MRPDFDELDFSWLVVQQVGWMLGFFFATTPHGRSHPIFAHDVLGRQPSSSARRQLITGAFCPMVFCLNICLRGTNSMERE